MTVRGTVTDHDGRPVELTEERWSHISERHPEIRRHEDAILRAVRAPDRYLAGSLENEQWYYAKTDAPSNWLKVVVAYAEGRGYIVTAHARRSMP
jgi:hypothetical protein